MTNLRKIGEVLKILDKIDRISDFDKFVDIIAESAVQKNQQINVKDAQPSSAVPVGRQHRKRRKNFPVSNRMRKKYLKDAQNPLESISIGSFYKMYGVSKETVKDILSMISHGLEKPTNRGQPINPMTELLLTLQFLKHGTLQTKDIRISQPTVSRIIKRVTGLLAELKLRFVKIPERSKFKTIATRFQEIGGCPEVFGCIGSCHVPIKSPSKNIADDFLNENGFYSFRVMLICGPDLEFFEVISRWPGASNANKIFNISEMYQRFEYNKMEGVLLASNQYACSNFVLTPIAVPHSSQEIRFNEAHERCYLLPKAVELWKTRFKCLQKVLHHKEETTQTIITACAMLHNLAIQRNEILPNDCTQSNKSSPKETVAAATVKNLSLPKVAQDAEGISFRSEFIDKYFV